MTNGAEFVYTHTYESASLVDFVATSGEPIYYLPHLDFHFSLSVSGVIIAHKCLLV